MNYNSKNFLNFFINLNENRERTGRGGNMCDKQKINRKIVNLFLGIRVNIVIINILNILMKGRIVRRDKKVRFIFIFSKRNI